MVLEIHDTVVVNAFPNRATNLAKPKKSVKWHRVWNSFLQTSNIVSLNFGTYLKGECMNQKAKPHKQSLAVEDQNDMWVFGLCCRVWEEFEYND